MKIVLINFQHMDATRGGVENRYRLLKSALEGMGHECHLVSTRTDSIESTVQLVYQCDLAISDSAICFETPCPMITVFGNPWISLLKVMPNVFIKRIADRERDWHAKHKTYRVAVSNFMAQEEMAAAGIAADQVIPNPADVGRFTDMSAGTGASDPLLAKLDPSTVLWIGPETPIKNYSQLALIRDRWPVECPDLAVQWSLPARETDRELDYLDMTAAVSQAAVVLCTSTAEGCSNTLMEALAADVPIVTTKTGLFWDWWDDRLGVRIDDPYDTPAFLSGLQTVLRNPAAYSPRKVVTENKFDLDHWSLVWQQLVLGYVK